MAKKRRGAPKKAAAEKARHRLVLMLTDEQSRNITDAAALDGKRPSAWARDMISTRALTIMIDHGGRRLTRILRDSDSAAERRR